MTGSLRTFLRRFLIPAVAVAAIAATAGPAAAAPKVKGEFPVSGVGTNNQIARGPDGNIWVTLDQTNYIARVTPNGTVTEFKPNAFTQEPVGITTGPDGNLWATQPGAVVKVPPGDPDNAVATTINDITDARIITTGPDGNLWTASGDNVIKIPPGNPAGFTSYATTGVQGARAIARGGDGTLWVADAGGNQLVNVTTAGAGTPYPTGGMPQGIARGPGRQMGYADPGTNPQTVGRIVPGGQVKPKKLDPARDPFGVAFGADNAYWFAQFANNRLGRLTPKGRYTQLSGFSPDSGPRQITTGPRRTLWVTLDKADKIARVVGVRAVRPKTTITKSPSSPVTTNNKGRAKVRFRFTSDQPGSVFRCRLAKKGRPGAAWRPCTSPQRYTVHRGRYTFKVVAIANGAADRTPAVRRFRVVRP